MVETRLPNQTLPPYSEIQSPKIVTASEPAFGRTCDSNRDTLFASLHPVIVLYRNLWKPRR